MNNFNKKPIVIKFPVSMDRATRKYSCEYLTQILESTDYFPIFVSSETKVTMLNGETNICDFTVEQFRELLGLDVKAKDE